MDVSSVSPIPMTATAPSRQASAVLETQMALLRELADSQEAIARMLSDGDRGRRIDVRV